MSFARKAAVAVPLSGPLNMGNFIERLLMQKWRACDCLHLDIGPTHELDLLDDILVSWMELGARSPWRIIPVAGKFGQISHISISFPNGMSPKIIPLLSLECSAASSGPSGQGPDQFLRMCRSRVEDRSGATGLYLRRAGELVHTGAAHPGGYGWETDLKR